MKKLKRGAMAALALILTASLFSGCGRKESELTIDSGTKDTLKTETDQKKKNIGNTMPVYTEDGVSYTFRTSEKKFQIYGKDGQWQDTFSVGVNIGAGKPGAFPGEFAITKDDYKRWFRQISEMHANTIRVYTILMPEFYEALAEYNARAEEPLYFIQGVYNNEEDISNISDAYGEDGKIANDWIEMCKTIVDVVHGNAVIEPVPGNASGTYTSDVSQYLMGWILGIEWQPDFVINTNENNADKTSFDGNYVYAEEASPFEVFLASGLDACISHETENYKMQHPTAFANWVTTDPLDHPGEPNPEMEDAVPVDAEHIKTKPEFKAGLFASYHVYPYYPEMMRYAPELLTDEPPNPYKHYLSDLNAHHTMPIVISEFGVPASRGITHMAKDPGFSQGGLTEEEQGNAIVSMLGDIIETGCAGAYVFIWQDEWFKRTWNTMDYTDSEVRPYWCDVQTSEQFFGLLSFDPGETAACTVDGDAKEWEGEKPLLTSGNTELYVRSDEAYVYLMIKGCSENQQIMIDTIENQGNSKYDGADFSLELKGEEDSRLLVDPYYDVNYWLYTTGLYADSEVLEIQEGYAAPDTNTFAPINLMLNRPVLLKDENETLVGTEQVETGKLRYGNADPESPDYNSRADFCRKGDVVEVRLPWLLLNISKPNAKMRIANLYDHDEITYESINDIKFAIDGVSASYSWEGWVQPTYRERLKQSYYILQDYLSKR
ncbi:MAG: family 2 glycosyl transferase [Lachnospiraceae bacterium]|nr:family 2 glycosyl transferase [Lachnospiraceae bacterium]